MSGPALRNNADKHCYELVDDDAIVAIAEYETDGNAVTFRHTEVQPGHEGKGYGSKLAKMALDDVVARGGRIVAQCEFIAAYLDRHPEYAGSVKAD